MFFGAIALDCSQCFKKWPRNCIVKHVQQWTGDNYFSHLWRQRRRKHISKLAIEVTISSHLICIICRNTAWKLFFLPVQDSTPVGELAALGLIFIWCWSSTAYWILDRRNTLPPHRAFWAEKAPQISLFSTMNPSRAGIVKAPAIISPAMDLARGSMNHRHHRK